MSDPEILFGIYCPPTHNHFYHQKQVRDMGN